MDVEVKNDTPVRLVECPRDAMQGWPDFIPTDKKIEYLNALLEVGFDTLDFGSFVSPKAIPQMADTRDVIEKLVPDNSKTRLLAIVANTRGATEAAAYPLISDIGFPFSISETFQQRNTHSSITESTKTVSELLDICDRNQKRLVIYISMAFGNPYGDPWSSEIVLSWMDRLVSMGVPVISLADTVGLADKEQVYSITRALVLTYPSIESGIHLHSRRENSLEKVEAAFLAGCRRFDGALNGIGGCPMAGDALVGNMDSRFLIDYFENKNLLRNINPTALANCVSMANEIFLNH